MADWENVEPPPGVPLLASWGRRLAALVVDYMLLLVPAAIGLGLALGFDNGPGAEPLSVVGFVLFFGCLTVLPAVYFTVLHGGRGQTVAKRWLGLRVIDAESGGPIGYGRAFVRWLIPFVLNLFCGPLNLLDGLWPLWDNRRQTWHDKAARSVVVRPAD